MSYIANDKLLESQKTKNVQNIEGLEETLKILLKGTGLKAIIKNDAIVIVKVEAKNKIASDSTSLDDVEVIENSSNTTEGSDSYTISSMNTSTKMNLSIKETPQSVSVITNDQMNDLNIQSFDDVVSSIAGITSQNNYSLARELKSRGFSIDYYQIDGIPTSYDGENQEDLTIYDRVEIVKGANGLMTGAGNPSASINYVRKNAKSKAFKGSIEVKTGSWDEYGASVDLASSLNKEGSIRGRVIASKSRSNSFLDEYEVDKKTLYAAFEADLSDNTLLSFTVAKIEHNDDNLAETANPIYFTDGTRTDFSRSTSFRSNQNSVNNKTTSASAKIEHTFNNDVKLSAHYSHKKTDLNQIRFWNRTTFPDKQTGQLNIGNGFNYVNKSKINSLDIYASVPFTLGTQKHEFLTGITYSKNNNDTSYYKSTGADHLSNVYNWNSTSPKQTYIYDGYTNKEYKQLGAYAISRFSISDDVKLMLGARVSNWKYNEEDYWPGSDPTKKNFTYNNNITPFLGIVYDITDQHSIYASYTSIFKPQTDKRNISGKHLDPKEGNSYELGLKSTLFNDSINSGITLFRIEQDNLAVKDSSNVIIGTTDQAYKLAEGVVSKGIEIDLSGEVNDNLTVNFGLSHYSAKDQNGEKINSTDPKTQITLFSKYKINKLSVGVGLNWQSKFYENTTNPATNKDEKIYQKAYYLVNTMAKYDIKDNLSLQLNVNNLFDKKYYSAIFYGARYRYGDPRNVTIKLNYTF